MIKVFVDEVHRTSADLYAVFERLPLPVESGECGQQRRMNVQYPIGKRFEKEGRDQAHVSRQANQINFVLAQASDNRSIVLGAGDSFALDYMGVEPTLFGGLQAGNIGLVGDHDCDLRSGNLSGCDVVGNGDEVGTASGEEYAESFHSMS